MNTSVIVDLGVQSFEKLRSRNAFYVDKTDLIREWWEKGSDVTLITRPRRFGKTLNLSMMECFFSARYAGRGEWFEGLSIWTEDRYRQMQGTFPVIFLSFASVKAPDYEGMVYSIKRLMIEVYEQNRFLLEGNILSENEKEYFNCIKIGMSDASAVDAINILTNFLSRCYNRNVLILLDEYDTPMQEAWLYGYWEEAVSFFRRFFNATFKTNPYICKGLVTGITRISKESVFSDLNNLEVITTTSDKYASYFGFTEQEVFQALEDFGFGEEKQGVKQWYDGFVFGSVTDIYNPWSIASFLTNGAKYRAYWVDTSSNELVNRLVREGSAGLKSKFETLLEGRQIRVPIDEQIVFHQLDEEENEQAVWSLLLAGGYLKAVSVEDSFVKDSMEEVQYELALTNFEVRRMFAKMVRGWFRSSSNVYNEFIRALLNDDVRRMNTFMNKVAMQTFSSFDSGRKPSRDAQPERLHSVKATTKGLKIPNPSACFYHGFVLGLVVDLADRYQVKSNRESGYGRYDVLIEPFDKKEKAFIFEFKVLDPDDDETKLEETVVHALAQIEEKKYETQLLAAGIRSENIRKYGFAFEGKKCLIGH